MDLLEIKKQIDELNIEIRNDYSDSENGVYPIFDGAFNYINYYKSNGLKIVWLMKEAYEDGEREGDWSYPDFYMQEYDKFYIQLIRGKSSSTWQPIVYTSYSIHNNYLMWDEMPNIEDDPEMVKVLDKIAMVNIQKLPSLTGSKTNIDNIYEAYRIHKNLIIKQIEHLNPDVVICGNVFSIIKKNLTIIKEGRYKSVEYYHTREVLYINAYHPAQTTISWSNYVEDIVNCLKGCLAL